MIVSVSRRTDIPAFYSEWFFNRLKDGEVLIRNSFNRKQVSKVILNKETVDCFVFWTKNPEPLVRNLHKLDGYKYYFQYTLTSYGDDIEVKVKRKQELINTFINLSKKIGKEKVIWRYDPILINKKYSKEYHYKWFEVIASKLQGYTNKCVISFVDEYKEIKKNANILRIATVTEDDMIEIATNLVKIANKYNIIIESCAEKVDLTKYGVKYGACIDANLISEITGEDLSNLKKDNMRDGCNCVKSIDIGEYNSCLHSCKYCYANYNSALIERNYASHNSSSPVLLGNLIGDEKITEHYLSKPKKKKNEVRQTNLFDEVSDYE